MAVFLFGISTVVLLYTFIGYPLIVGLMSRWKPRPHQRDPRYQPSVTIVLVARNETARLNDKLRCCLDQDYPRHKLDVVVVSDGSTDSTAALARAIDPQRVTVLEFGERRGKSACLNDGVAASRGDLIVFCDARQMLNARAVAELASNFVDPHVGAVSGELMFVSDDSGHFGQGVDAYWRYEKFIRKSEAALGSVVGATGALYAIRRALYCPIPDVTILDDVLIPMQIAMAGHRVVFEPQAHAYDKPLDDPSRERLRKVRTLAGNFQLLALRPTLLSPWRNALFWPFISHKVARLTGPFALVGALIGSLASVGRSPLWLAVATACVALCVSPLLVAAIPALGRIKLFRLASAFVWLNAFVVLGLKEYLTNRDAHLWKAGAIQTPEQSGRH